MIREHVARDRSDPGADTGGVVQGLETLVDPDESLLHEVVGIGDVAGLALEPGGEAGARRPP
jgi:hypothetical protein